MLKENKETNATSIPKVFTFNPANQPIRVEVINNEPWFIAQDVTDALGVDRTQTRKLDADEKGVQKIHTPGGTQEMTIVNESGLYNLIFRSNKPEAHVFRKWVTSEILPSIRKTGKYEVVPTDPTRVELSPGIILKVVPSSEHTFLVSTKEIARALKVSASALRANKMRGNFKKGIHFLDNYPIKETGGMLAQPRTVYTRLGLIEHAYHIKSGYASQLRDWAECQIMNKPFVVNSIKELPQKRNHNRLTSDRLIRLLTLTHRIDDAKLRNEIVEQLMGGH
ncbi:MAG: hypothetical protein LBN95_07090 [Prevotellaceae bacterium]|jgi:prophage antirepressor-like protein|nr:hypothetical protein [Prevotellaceae bacterium]